MTTPPHNPVSEDRALFPARFRKWLASGQGRFAILALAACFSLPASFANSPSIGLDPSWQLSLQLAAMQGKVFGREFIFTYGPLGWLLIHFPVSKLGLLSYDFFILGSLLSIYKQLLPPHPRLRDAMMVIALAIVTKMGLSVGSSTVLFTVLCYWLWIVHERGEALGIVCCLASALLLFFSKVNYGLIMVGLIPAYGIGLLVLPKKRHLAGFLLLFGFPLLVWLGAILWHVDLPRYLRSASELIAGYNEAMFVPADQSLMGFELACLFLLAMSFAMFFGRHRLPWMGQVMILPLIGLASLLLFKNAFVRFDKSHNDEFYVGLPLLLALWYIAWRFQNGTKALLLASLLYPLALLVAETEHFGHGELVQTLPLHYVRGAFNAPWRQSSSELQYQLQIHFPESVISEDIRRRIGKSSVDVMPWDSSIAILNGLNLKERPVPQSYTAYTIWLDALNASFLSSHEAADNILYICAQLTAIDGRPAAWDESLTKRTLLENYTFGSEFKLPMRVSENQEFKPADIFLLKHTPDVRRLIPILTNEVSLTLNQALNLPITTNLLFLTLNVDRTLAGRLKGFILSPSMLTTTFQYQDGSSNIYRAVLPILKTGVMVNRRVESPNEIRNWLQTETARNMAVTSICFNAHSPWAFKPIFKGTLTEYRFSKTEGRQ